MPSYRRKLIEVALPLEAINVASAREKSIRHGHPSTLHLWWARRPLAACRAVIFTSLVDDPDDPTAPANFIAACRALPLGKNSIASDTPRQRLFDFIERLVTWEATTDEVILEKARELIRLCTNGNPPPLLDPFAGGGSIPLEAQRLGLEAHASDLNPVAVMINKALIEIPPKFANRPPVNPRDRAGTASGGSWKGAAGLAADVRYYGEWMRDRAWERIGHLYPKHNGETVIAWLWARTVKCPNPACGATIPLIRDYSLSNKKGRNKWLEPQIDKKEKVVSFIINHGKGKPSEPTKVGRGARFRCLVCDELTQEQYIKDEGFANRVGYQLLAIATDGTNGRNYYPANNDHEYIAKQAIPQWKPDTELVNNPRHMSPPLYGMTKHKDLFTSRQLVALNTFSELIEEVQREIVEDAKHPPSFALEADNFSLVEYAKSVAIYLSFIIDKLADLGNSLCPWEPVAECPRNLFGRQLVSMSWNFAEGNVMSDSSGSWNILLNNFTRNFINTIGNQKGFLLPAEVSQADVLSLFSSKRFLISTDPPYYDNVPYADLSDFFYIWLRKNLGSLYPDVFSTLLVPKEPELVADEQRSGGKENARLKFENGLEKAFSNFHSIHNINFPLTIFYAFKQAEEKVKDEAVFSTGWETMLEGLLKAGFSVQGTWPMRTELTQALKTSQNFLASSIVLVCRPRPDDAPTTSRRDFVNALRRELPPALREMQSGSIAPVDLAQASIGPGMAVYSRYAKVLEPDGSRLTVRTALQLINHELDAYLTEQEGAMDADSRFAIAWFEQFGFNEGGFGQADVLARAKNTSVDGLRSTAILAAEAGKVRLLTWQELDPGWDPTTDARPTVWEATHHLIERLNTHGEDGAARLLAKMPPDLAADARQLAYRLYSLCERKSWADLARDYNALVISWNASQEQARTFKDQVQQGKLFG